VRLNLPASSADEIEASLIEANNRVADRDQEAINAFEDAGFYFGRFLATVQSLLDPELIFINAHAQFVSVQYPCGKVFQGAVQRAIDEANRGRQYPLDQLPRLEWHKIDADTHAVAAGAAAWHHFLEHPIRLARSAVSSSL
jgi:predicted NBD/HSP70 family sugar kinase